MYADDAGSVVQAESFEKLDIDIELGSAHCSKIFQIMAHNTQPYQNDFHRFPM